VLLMSDAAKMIWGTDQYSVGYPPGLGGAVNLGFVVLPQYQLFLCVVGPLIAVAMWLLVDRTRWGRIVRAATQDREMLAALGVNVPMVYAAVFTIGSALAGVGGALAAPRVLGRRPFGRAVVLGPLVSVAAMLLMVATLVWPSALLASASFLLFGAGPIVWTISSTTLRQTVTPPAMLGRVSAIFLAVNTGARPLGAALGGWVGAGYGIPACLLLALCGFVLQALIISASAVRPLQRLPAA